MCQRAPCTIGRKLTLLPSLSANFFPNFLKCHNEKVAHISKYLCTSMNNCTEANVQCVYGGYMRVREVVALYFPLVLIFSKQCTGKQEQNISFSLSLNKILFHTWVLLCPRINLFYFVVCMYVVKTSV